MKLFLQFLGSPSGRVTLIYLLVGSVWIVASDRLLASFDVPAHQYQTVKGLLFVVVTAAVLALLLRREWFFRVRSAEQLERATHRQNELARIVERAPTVAFVWERADGWPVRFVSRNVTQWGYDRQDFSDGLLFANIVHPEDLERVGGEVDAYANEGHLRFDQEYRILTQDRQTRWVRDWTFIERSASGDIDHLEGVLLDITDRKTTEADLKLKERAVNAVAAGVTIVDMTQAHQPLIYANEGFVRLTGFDRDEILGRNCRFLQGEDDAQFERTEMREAIAAGKPARTTLRNYRKDGSMFWNELILSPVLDEHGRLTHFVGIQTDVTERVETEHRLRLAAYTDSLTRLPNRAGFLSAGDNGPAGQLAEGRYLLAVANVRGMGAINDTYGTAVGDSLLKALAECIREEFAEALLIGRTGGDRLAILLHLSDRDDSHLVAMQYLQRLGTRVELAGTAVTPAISVGYCEVDGPTSIATALSQAETALTKTKDIGHNVALGFQPKFAADTKNRTRVSEALGDAVANQELAVHYQPKVDLRTGQMKGAEALLRWHHPILGVQSPGTFIPIAEASGLIVEIGEWVLADVCTFISQMQDEKTPCPGVAVNVSAAQLRQGDIARRFDEIVKGLGISPDQIVLELTESMFVGGAQSEQAVLELHRQGFPIAMDDFGTGYSSLAFLRRYPLSEIKIDQSFVREIVHSEFARNVVQMIQTVAHSLGSSTVAEGIETAEQVRVLLDLGCDTGQGFYFAHPMTAPVFAEQLRSGLRLPSSN